MRGPPSGNLSPSRTSRTVPAKGSDISHGSRKTAEAPRDECEQEQEGLAGGTFKRFIRPQAARLDPVTQAANRGAPAMQRFVLANHLSPCRRSITKHRHYTPHVPEQNLRVVEKF